MVWNKPRNVWQWLLLLSPAGIAIAASQIAKWCLPQVPPLHLVDGDLMDIGAHIQRLFPITFFLIMSISFSLAMVLTRGIPPQRRFFGVILALFCLVLVNGFVAFSGCAVGGILVPGPVPQ